MGRQRSALDAFDRFRSYGAVVGEGRQGSGRPRLPRSYGPWGLCLRFAGTCYRAHDPRGAFKPTSGEGAAIRGARFNPKGLPAHYLALSIMTAVKETN